MRLRRLLWLGAALAAASPAAAQSVTSREFGRLSDGRKVHEYLLDSGTGMRVRLLDYGGIIRAVEVPDQRGHNANVALSLASLADHEKRPNFSAIIGRYANRLSGGGVAIDGVFYKLATNERGVISHGGAGGFGQKLWQAVPVRISGRAAVMLRLTSPAGDNGFPGTLLTEVTFSVGRDHTLRLDYRATTDAPTVVNLTHHAFFNLAGAGTGSIDRHWIRVLADRFMVRDPSGLPTGEIRTVAGSALDLRHLTEIGPRLRASDPQVVTARGFDHNFEVRTQRSKGGKLPLVACLYDPGSGRAMLVRTDQPGIQLYSANGFDGTLKGDASLSLRQGDGIAFETQHPADSPRHRNFPTTLLRPGQVFTTSTSFTFIAAKPHSRIVPGC